MSELRTVDSAFWRVLAMRLIQHPMRGRHRLAAGRWLGALAVAPERERVRREIVRAIEDTALQMLALAEASGGSDFEQRVALMALMVPLLEDPLTRWVDPTLARLMPFVLSQEHERGTVAEVRNASAMGEQLVRVVMTDPEEEAAAIDFVKAALAEGRLDDLNIVLDEVRFRLLQPVEGLAEPVPFPIRVPLVRLLIHDDRDIQAYVVARLFGVLRHVDPPLASALQPLQVPRLETNSLKRRRAIRRFCRDYLASTFYDLRRDLAHGLKRLRNVPLATLDAICGARLDLFTDATSLKAVVFRNETDLPPATVLMLNLLLVSTEEDARDQIERIRGLNAEIRAQYGGSGIDLSELASGVLGARNVFHGYHCLLMLLALCSEVPEPDVTIEVASESLPAQEWLRRCIRFLLTAAENQPGGEPDGLSCSGQDEVHRRNIHALSMRVATWVSTSPGHIRELAEQSEPSDRVISWWLLRALILADRLSPVLGGSGELDLAEAERALETLNEVLEVARGSSAYPDVLDPFLYGVDRYDHSIATLLGLLRLSWDAVMEGAAGVDRPFWWSAELQTVLEAIKARPETEAERILRARRDLPNSNRLQVMLTKTVGELAYEILELASLGDPDPTPATGTVLHPN